jgi:chitin synthase
MRDKIRTYIDVNFNLTDFDYMFCTDADSIICHNSFQYLIESIEKRNAVACCGLVKIDFSEGAWSFWCIFQNFQYLFGQYVRRSVESLYGRVVCLPGCITMFKIHESAIKAIKMYSEFPKNDEMFKSIVQLLGTDRRLTSSFLFQGKDIKTVLDKRAICLTIPPCTLYTYLTQRRRWASNSYFNTVAILFGPNQYLITRVFATYDVIRMSIIYFRIFTTIMFVYKIIVYLTGGGYPEDLLKKLAPCIAILFFPTVFFTIICLSHNSLRHMFHKILLGYLINRVFGMILNLAIISNLFWNIGSTIWGANQTSQPEIKTENQVSNQDKPPVQIVIS